MRWRRETWVFLAWLALTVGACSLVEDRGAAGLGLVGCERWPDSSFSPPFGECGDAFATLGLVLLVLLVGAIGLLVTAVSWLRSRPVQRNCPGCASPVMPSDERCPRCQRELGAPSGPPAGWGTPDGR